MGWQNPPLPWAELERSLSGNPPTGRHQREEPPGPFSQARDPVVTTVRHQRGAVGYAELHCHSNFSFLDGASHPEDLAEEAARLGLEALAVTDHDGMYGVVRFAEAAEEIGLPTVFGSEVTLGATQPQNGIPDPEGRHLLLLARDPEGYGRLCRAITAAQMRGEKGAPRGDLELYAEHAGGHWQVLTGCRKGTVPAALVANGPAAAARELQGLIDAFGRDHVAVELWDHCDPLDSARNDALAELGAKAGVAVVATNNVHYARPTDHLHASALAAVRARRSLDEMRPWQQRHGCAHLRSGEEQAQRFARYPGVVARAAEIGRACAFPLSLVAPKLPDWPVPVGHTEMTWLRQLTYDGARDRYGPRPGVEGGVPLGQQHERVKGAWKQIDHELDLIDRLGFAGYFLIVHDIVAFCRKEDILCQGRGSAANSAVCYALGITAADAVKLELLFERFLSEERGEPPDIDLDIEAGRREEAIQYVYNRYGRDRAAQVCNVITYRPRSAVRDLGKALGHAQGQVDAWSKLLDLWGRMDGDEVADVPPAVVALARRTLGFPRHLGIHSGGMVICDRPVVEVCPVEWARMENRTVLQWDKDDCAAAGLVKFDLLGLGMLTALHEAIDLIAAHDGVTIDLAQLPQDDAVYEMLCEADSVGVFQVESRAQMATLPRLRPRRFYDLVVEVALIRPGPIQGGSVHPYIRRRNGREAVTYLHPCLEKSLKRTLGVPLFQEQLMQMAIDAAGFTPSEANTLREAMSSKRSEERMGRLRGRLYEGMAQRGITGAVADKIWDQISAFANFGFPESHSVSFAYLVYASAWLKRYYPAAFLAALLNAQPMGFYSPQSLVADARRHGVTVRGPDLNVSASDATIEPDGPVCVGKTHNPVCVGKTHNPVCVGKTHNTVRLGLQSVRTFGEELADRVAAGRPYADLEDLQRRCTLTSAQLEALATAGALGCLGMSRRAALWAAGAAAHVRADRLPQTTTGLDAPALPVMTRVEQAGADLWATGVTPDSYPMEFFRDRLDALGVTPAAALHRASTGRIRVAGVVTHRQRPATAQGTIFVNLEDESGLINVICSKGVWSRHRRVAQTSSALLVHGRLERADNVVNVVADRIEALSVAFSHAGGEVVIPVRSRDFR